MSFFGNMKKAMEMQSKAKKAQKALKNIHVESEDTDMKVTVSGDMKIVAVEFYNNEITQDEDKLKSKFVELTNKALEKAQKVSAENMKDIMGDMDLSSLLGGGQ